MSFAPETDKLVNELIQAEYGNACDNWGGTYNSLHEGYAVLFEEAEESEYEFDKIKATLPLLWANVRYSDKRNVEQNLDVLLRHTQNAIKELAQVNAVIQKIRNTLNKEK